MLDTRLLAADVGAAFTKVFLLQEVEGERRLVATGAAPTVGDDGQPAVTQALARALDLALSRVGAVTRREADAIPRLLMTSLHAVPHVAVVAPRVGDARTALSALEALPVRVMEPVVLDGAGGDPETLLGQLEAQSPDAIVVVGGASAADEAPAQGAVEALARGFGTRVPLLVLAGAQRFVDSASQVLGSARHVAAAGDSAQAATALQDAARELTSRRLGARAMVGQVRGWSGPVASSLEGVGAATQLIAERYDVDVLTLDLGAAHAMAVSATGTAGRRRLVSAVRDDLGVRSGQLRILREVGAGQLNRWLPSDADAESLLGGARRAAQLPAGVPESIDDLLVEHAFAREALRMVIQDLAYAQAGPGAAAGAGLQPVDLLIGSGGALARVPRLMQAVMILLDAAQPDALTQLALDRTAALPLLGQVGLREGAASLGAGLERDGLLNLGLCIAPVGIGREGELAIKVEVAYASRSPVTVEVPFGAIEVVPLPLGDRAALKLWPSKEFDVGLGRGNAATPRTEVEGGAVGIIVDARGRPLQVPDTAEKRQAKLLQWLHATRAYPPLSFVQPATPVPAGGPG